MIVKEEKENAKKSLLNRDDSSTVPKLETIPALNQTGSMELNNGKYDQRVDITTNGPSVTSDVSQMMNEEDEIEAAAAQSEAQLKAPVVYPQQSSYKPLQVYVNGLNGTGSAPSTTSGPRSSMSTDSSSSLSVSSSQRKPIPPSNPPLYKQRESVPGRPINVIMGPPSASSSAAVLLSPAGNFINGSGRISAESAKSAFNQKIQARRDSAQGPSTSGSLVQRSPVTKRPHTAGVPNSSLSAFSFTASPSISPHNSNASTNSTRKEIEMVKRRTMTDKIHKMRVDGALHCFVPQFEGQTDIQLAMVMRKTRSSDSPKCIPPRIRNEVFEDGVDDPGFEPTMRFIKEENHNRIRNNEIDELTDISGDEDEVETVVQRYKKEDLSSVRVETSKLRWAEKKPKVGSMMLKAEGFLREANNKKEHYEQQMSVLNISSGCRFEGEEIQPRKRRKMDGTFTLFDSSDFVRGGTEEYGCSKARPLHSWTKREFHRDVFNEKNDSDAYLPGCSDDQKLPNSDGKSIAIGSHNVSTKIVTEERPRETVEYDFEQYEVGNVFVEMKATSPTNAVDYVATNDYIPMEDRMMKYLYYQSCVPSVVLRKSVDRSIYTDSADGERKRNGVGRLMTKNRKKEKRGHDSSEDEEIPAPKKGVKGAGGVGKKRGRPATAKPQNTGNKKAKPARANSKPSQKNYRSNFYNYIEEQFIPAFPTKIQYARIHVPSWHVIPENFFAVDPNTPSTSTYDLRDAVARDHHKMMHLERERFIRDMKKTRNKTAGSRAAATPGATPRPSTEDPDEELLELIPPYDSKIFEPNTNPIVRRFPSIATPYPPRDFSSSK